MKEFTLIGCMMYQGLEIEADTVGDESTKMDVETVFVMLLVIILMPGMGQVLPFVVVGYGMPVGVLVVRHVRSLSYPEQQGMVE